MACMNLDRVDPPSRTTEFSTSKRDPVALGGRASYPRPIMQVVLTIAGSDPSGGAGLQGDLKTLAAFGVYGAAVPTLLTVQNTAGVSEVEVLEPDHVRRQLRAVLDDLPVAAIKIGALGSAAMVRAVADELATANAPWPVVDPVMGASLGQALSGDGVGDTLRRHLLPRTALLTPNLPEAERLLGRRIGSVQAMAEAARDLAGLGPMAVLLKGGHVQGPTVVDVLHVAGETISLPAERLDLGPTHGTGCALSSAIAALLARGNDTHAACQAATLWLRGAMLQGWRPGQGLRLLNHAWRAPRGTA